MIASDALITEVTMPLITRIVVIHFRPREMVLTKIKTGTLLVAVTMIIARILIILINNPTRQGLVIRILTCKTIKILPMQEMLILLLSSKIKMVLGTSDATVTLVARDQVVSYVVN